MFGASADQVSYNQEFSDDKGYPYPLISDPDAKLIKALGILKGKVAGRVTFVIGKDGKIAKIYDTVKPATHAKDVLEFVKGLK